MVKFSLTFRFLIYTFLTAIIINPIVISAHILTAGSFNLSSSAKIVMLSFGVSIVFFALVCTALLLVSALFRKKSKETRYWTIMLFAIGITAIFFGQFHAFAPYNYERGVIAAISAFTIMVSLAAQYNLFIEEHPSPVL